MKKLMLAGLLVTSTLATTAYAHGDKEYATFTSDHCSINMNYGVVVEANSIRFLDNDNTIVQINNQKDLFVNGKQVDLNDDQQALVSDYAAGVNEQIPRVVNIALDAVEIAFSALSHVATGLTGEENTATDSLNESFAAIREKVSTRFHSEDGAVYLAEQDFDDLDQFIEDELEGEIENLVANSVGDILIAVGQAMNDEEGDFEQKMEAFGERMERMGEDIEVAVEAQAEELGAEAELLCEELHDLNKIESQLSESVTALADFDLIEVRD
ncbi:YggN family protein [Thalassotalea mangrovi]|uniref:DUF2884 family protein n=1 Tax=Thalassotalea mangrovi TaxID=2572245 RepID=A0A4U1B8S3_9GAMM|nr:YggN family protein [Thalassotalea mangrovi]TKB47099.1 DUF2884 family protein [Thalassotalea mangrovi]